MNSPSIKKIMNPADKVTTEYLQRARRYAQRKRLPRISHATSRNTGQHSAQNSEDSQPSSSKNDNATTNDIPELMAPFQPPGYPPLGRVCCAGYSAVRISDLLRQLPPSVHEYAAQIGPISFDGAAFSPSVGLQSNQVATKTLHRSIDSAYARRLLENPSLAHITVTLDLATQIKKSVKANGPMEALLDKSSIEIQRSDYDLDVLFSELDCLCLFLCDLLRDKTTPGAPRINYTRLMPGGQSHRPCVLACWCCHSTVSSDGQIEVRIARLIAKNPCCRTAINGDDAATLLHCYESLALSD